MKVTKNKYYDEFWGAKYPYYEYDFEFDESDEKKIIEATIDKVVEIVNPKYMKNELITFLGDNDEYYDIEVNLTNYINDAYQEIIKNKKEYFDSEEDFLDWQKEANQIYKKYLKN